MRQTNDPWVMAGPLFQPIRGILFGMVFYLLREPFFEKKDGWLVMWIVLVVVGIIGTFGPTPGSLEEMLSTVFPLWVHLKSLPDGPGLEDTRWPATDIPGLASRPHPVLSRM